MLQLGEDTAKHWLRQRGLPVPAGESAATPEEAARIAASMPAGVMVKAVVPTGRRGKAGAVLAVDSAPDAAEAARQLLGRTDIRVHTLVEVRDGQGIDTRQVPIVIRLFGAGEAEARQLVAGRPGIHYPPRGTTLQDAVAQIVRLTAEAPLPQ
jgi:succinyl-CoA synthetase beta subunit